jgi:ABC-type multidrug transport system fused ATPase/permease subunit
MGPSERSAAQNERNALSFGWHVGYYNFFVTIESKPARAGEKTKAKLDARAQEVISEIQPELKALSTYFGMSTEFKAPSSPNQAKRLYINLGNLGRTSLEGARIERKLQIDFGSRVASFYELGKMIVTYALMHDRDEPEIVEVASGLRRDIVNLSTQLDIERALIEQILSHEELMLSRDTLRNLDLISKDLPKPLPEPQRPSIWVNGSFYLVAILTIIAAVGVLGANVPIIVLPILVVGGLLFVIVLAWVQLAHEGVLETADLTTIIVEILRTLPVVRLFAGRRSDRERSTSARSDPQRNTKT